MNNHGAAQYIVMLNPELNSGQVLFQHLKALKILKQVQDDT